MKAELHIVVIEDVVADVVLINHELRKGGLNFRITRVETKAEFLNEMENHPPDLVLSDHGVPAFDGFSALAVTREKWPDVPFIFISGEQTEELTTHLWEGGATDHVLKSRLFTLVPAVRRALREVESSAERKQLEMERDGLRTELQTAVARIRTLHGLLPICVACDRTRDDEGYWKRIHAYVREHSSVIPDEGLCLDCLQKRPEPDLDHSRQAAAV
jgi:CheY-like chemotaxis protein